MSNVIKSQLNGQSNEKIIPIQLVKPRLEQNTQIHNEPEPDLYSEIINKAKAEAEEIIAAAKRKAQQIQAQLDLQKQALAEEREQVLHEANKCGFEQGFAEGEKQGFQKVTSLLEQARGIVQAAEKDYHQHIAKAEATILAIGMKAAEKILHIELENNPECFQNIVKDAIKEAKKYKKIYIRIHPDYYPFLVDKKNELVPGYFQFEEVYLYPDEKLAKTDCIIETEGERIEAGVDTQFQELKEKLFELYTRDHDET